MPQTFAFPYHTLEVAHPESSVTVRFGRGWSFASKPKGPNQVTYRLKFRLMKFFLNPDGSFDKVTQPAINMALLEDFYLAHQLYEPFTYPHPALGNITVRFARPLEYSIMEEGHGATEPFQLELLTQP